MSTRRTVHWIEGEERDRERIDRALASAGTPVHANTRRTVLAFAPMAGDAEGLIVKRHHPGRSRARDLRDRVFDRRPAWREWRALRSLYELDLPVPRPLALGIDATGDAIVAMRFVGTMDLATALREADAARRATLTRTLARLVERLHESGFAHGDLHLGNLRVEGDALRLLDLQECRRTRRRSARRRDLARLLHSLEQAVDDPSPAIALLEALPDDAGLDRARRAFLRDHARGRARKQLRPGAAWQPLETDAPARRGLGLSEAAPRALTEAILEAAPLRSLPSRREGRVQIDEIEALGSIRVRKRVVAGSLRRSWADRLRGSSSARAFRRGSRDQVVSTRSAQPLAFLDLTSASGPLESTLLLDHVGEVDLDRWRPRSRDEALEVGVAVARWLAEQHAIGLGHRDAKGGNIRVSMLGDHARFWWIDLEDLTGPHRLSEARRLHALVQLNASLADEAFDDRARRAALEAYGARLPFRRPIETIARILHERSLARRHRYRGRSRGE